MLFISRLSFIILIVFSFLVFGNSCAYSASADLRELNSIELQLFNQNYINDSIDKRLSRIENIIFGRVFNDADDKRIVRLISIVRNQKVNNSAPESEVVNNPIPHIQDNSVTDYPAITQLETRVFHQNFKSENIYSRLNRLESRIFGSAFPSNNLSDRVDRLKEILDSDDYKDNNSISALDPEKSRGSIYSNTAALEMRYFGRMFDKELITERIERLEGRLFGRAQSGTMDKRLANLNNIADSKFIPPPSDQSSSFSQNNNFNSWNDDFFNEQNNQEQFSQAKPGILEVVQALALPFILNYLNKNNSNDQYNSQNYYQNPYYYQTPYGYKPSPYYPGYQGSIIYPNSNYPVYVPNNYQGRILNQGIYGAGVRIIP